jgi:hypothetical protein
MTSEPWRIEKIKSTWRHALSPPTSSSHAAVVVFEGGNCLGLLGSRTLSTKGLAQGAYRFHIVPLGLRTVTLSEQVRAQELTRVFEAQVEVKFKVADAMEIAKLDPPDLDDLIGTWIRDLLREFDGKYSADQWQPLQQAIQQHLRTNRTRLGTGIQVESCAVHAKSDQRVIATNEQILAARDKQDVLRAEGELKKLEIQQEQDQQKMRMNFYAEILKEGRYERLALLLVDKSEEVKQVVSSFEKERDKFVQERWDLFKRWLFADDAPLIASRLREMVEGLILITDRLGGDEGALSEHAGTSARQRRLSKPEADLDELIETWKEEVADLEAEEARPNEPETRVESEPKKKRDPEDSVL